MRCGKKVTGTWQYDEEDIRRLSTIMTLRDAGFSSGEAETYMRLMLEGDRTRGQRIQMLSRLRDNTLHEIHFKQRQLDRLDYLRYKILHAGKQAD